MIFLFGINRNLVGRDNWEVLLGKVRVGCYLGVLTDALQFYFGKFVFVGGFDCDREGEWGGELDWLPVIGFQNGLI